VVLVELLLEEVYDLARVEPEVAGVAREHALGVAALGHVLVVALLEGHEDVLAQLQDLGGLGDGEPELVATGEQHLAEARARHAHCTSL
jgi:hypothetical protein